MRTLLLGKGLVAFEFAALAYCESGGLNSKRPVSDADCDCFLVNGSTPTYYTRHLFYDFRNLVDYAGVPDVISNATESSQAPPTSDYFKSDQWTSQWNLQSWNNKDESKGGLSGDATILMVNSPNNIYIEKDNDDGASSETFLTMRTQHLPGFQTAAEFEASQLDYQFLSLRMLARTVGDPGAVTAMFTYRGGEDLAGVQEADIEVLTRDPTEYIHYTNQPSYTEDGDERPEATQNATMPGAAGWDDWVVHRLDWTPTRSVWYVDGAEAASIEFQTPRDPAGVNFNVWSNGGSWSGNMSLHDAAYMHIQWIEMVFNTTGAGDSGSQSKRADSSAHVLRRDGDGGCKAVCSIDETSETGKATLLWEEESSDATILLRASFGVSGLQPFIFMSSCLAWLYIL